MKRYSKIMAFLCAGLMLTAGCSKQNSDIDISAAVEKMHSEITFSEQMTVVDGESANRVYGISEELVDETAAISGSGATAESLAMWKAVDEDAAKELENQLETFLDGYIKGYSEYKPEEVPKLEGAVLSRDGVYVVLCVSADNNAAKSVISDAFNG